ncbi:hypothetical protein KKE92_05875 [Candidatus Micrarchaeota archaeon]|nr:hypothetical protein [Candidatus Micrarchaeota archaeon]MBU1681888.1 hypothetical protein [Candidatus Micrarchaeota archaeon]
MTKADQIIAEFVNVGVSEHDAQVLADCIITRKSCSWVSTEDVNNKMLKDVDHVIEKNNYGLSVKVDSIPTRSKFIWDVKVL